MFIAALSSSVLSSQSRTDAQSHNTHTHTPVHYITQGKLKQMNILTSSKALGPIKQKNILGEIKQPS